VNNGEEAVSSPEDAAISHHHHHDTTRKPFFELNASHLPAAIRYRIQSAFKLFDSGDYVQAFPMLIECHMEDPSNPELLHRLGYISCLMKNYKASFNFYHRAATEGQKASSYNNLGIMYARGLGVNRCYEKAMQCYLKAYKLGDKGGAINIGNLFKRGSGVDRNYAMAIYWYRNAKGHPGSNLSLGLMFHYGLGVERNMHRALQYFQEELVVSGASQTTLSFVDYAKCCIVKEQCCIGRI